MGLQQFEEVIVIGCGKIASNVLQFVNRQKTRYGYEVSYIEHEQSALSVMKAVCEKNGISYYLLKEKKQVRNYFESDNKRVLILSAGNYYIFPQSVINKTNIVIVNFHSALLPKYPGRNAPTWAIFHDERESGATWHYVTPEIDNGQYIIQKRCSLTKDIKAYELTKKIMELAYEGLQECFEDIMFGKIKIDSGNKSDKPRKIYYSYEIPNQGWFNISDDVCDIYKLLRATDYGKSRIFPAMKTKLPDGRIVEITSYKKMNLEIVMNEPIQIDEDKQDILVMMDDGFVLKMKYITIKD